MLQRCGPTSVGLPETRNVRTMPNDYRGTLRVLPQRRQCLALALALLVSIGGFVAETASGEEQRRGQRRGRGGMNAAQHNARGVELIGEDKLEEALESLSLIHI